MSSESSQQPPAPPERGPLKAPTLLQTINSVSAAFLGVQSSKNRERDFTKGKASHFIVVGLAMTGVFILVVVLAVKLALKNAGVG